MHLMILLLALDLTTIRNEPNLEHRSDLALDYANTALDAAREALNAGEDAKFLASLGEAREAVELSWHSLTDSGKYARNSNSFKRAEVRTRGLMRRLDGLRDLAGIDEKTEIEKVHARVAEIHDELIQGIMGKKVKKQE
jgi:hypothetical protein